MERPSPQSLSVHDPPPGSRAHGMTGNPRGQASITPRPSLTSKASFGLFSVGNGMEALGTAGAPSPFGQMQRGHHDQEGCRRVQSAVRKGKESGRTSQTLRVGG